MKQKKNNKTLLILLVIVAILIGALEIYERYNSANIRNNITDVNISKITRIAISNAKADQYLSLRKEESGWFVSAEKVKIPIENQSIEKIQPLLAAMTPLKVISSDKNDWIEFETSDELGLRITTYNVKDILSDFFIGKVDTIGDTITYVRVQGEPEIYSVKGDIRKIFTQDFFEQIFPTE